MPNLPPFVAFGNEELKDVLHVGDWVECPHCDDRHRVIGGKREDGTETDVILAYKCGGKTWVAGVNGKSIMKKYAIDGGNLKRHKFEQEG